MENVNLKTFSLMCDCAASVAKFGILSDFLKKGITDFYSYKTKDQELPQDEMDILNSRYLEFQKLFEEIRIKKL